MKQEERFYLSSNLVIPTRKERVGGLPLVSIITPSYNYGHFIERTIKSILAQTYPNIEYIIVDGGSTDDTVEVIRKYESYGISRWISEPDDGQTDAINQGFAMCSGDLFAWLNADDAYAYPEVIQEVVDAYQQGAKFISGEWEAWDGEGNLYPEGRKWGQSNPVTYEELLRFWEHICPPQPATFVDRALAENVFPLDTSVQCFMDFQLFLGVLAQKPQCYWTQKRWADFVFHGANKSLGNYTEEYDEKTEYLKVFMDSCCKSLSQKKQSDYQKNFNSYFLTREAIKQQNRLSILQRYLKDPSFFHNCNGAKFLGKASLGFGPYEKLKAVISSLKT